MKICRLLSERRLKNECKTGKSLNIKQFTIKILPKYYCKLPKMYFIHN